MTPTLNIIVKINNITNSKSIIFQKFKNKKTAKLDFQSGVRCFFSITGKITMSDGLPFDVVSRLHIMMVLFGQRVTAVLRR
jgi:hypothetical protein